jgi:uncharacterized protein
MILKLIIMGAVIYGVYFIFFKKPEMLKKGGNKDDSETVVECEECGVYVSVKESVMIDGKQFCSKECAGLK